MPETKIDVKHLLEDIRDSYPCLVEEAILTELIANSLDSGCSKIDIRVEPEQRRLTFADNGTGMGKKDFEQYHDIASTGKVRGKGIGFAGVGAKLALLVSDHVLTETNRGREALCSTWNLQSSFRAPWDFVGALNMIPGGKGTAVRLHFHDKHAPQLQSTSGVEDIVRQHFYPLLDGEFAKVLSHIYPEGVAISVNGELVSMPSMTKEKAEYFLVRLGKRKKLLGIGFIVKTKEDLPEPQRGLAVSTFGKVIKRGWEWLGITPRNPARLAGVVELPELVECLTTNKCDFMRDPNSLQKYYKCRKAIQDAVERTLESLGEARVPEPKADKGLERLQKEIDKVVGEILPDFPELAPLFGRKRSGEQVTALTPDPNGDVSAGEAQGTDMTAGDEGGPGEGEGVEGTIEGVLDGTHLESQNKGDQTATEHTPKRKRPGLMIGFDDETGGDALAWLRGNTLFINAQHPAYERVRDTHSADLYITFAVASTLSVNVEEHRTPTEFLQRFMAAWGAME